MNLDDAKVAIDRLRRPAGISELWETPDALLANFRAFAEAFHRGSQSLHVETVDRMLARELELDSDVDKIRPDLETHVLRRINDGIAWAGLAEERHVVKAVCHWNTKRGLLTQSNPEAVFAWIAESIDLKDHFAVWTDSTSFMGIGDVAVFGPLGHYQAIEIKELGEFIHGFPSSTPKEALQQFRKSAKEIKGQSGGDKTAGRLERQLKRARLAEELVQNDGGVHPFSKVAYDMTDHGVPEEFYGNELEPHIYKALQGQSSCHLVEGCIWVVAYPRGKVLPPAFLGSAHMVFYPELGGEDMNRSIERIKSETFSSLQMQAYPVVKPPSLLDLDDDCAAAILCGEVVLLSYLDWGAFGTHVAEPLGARFKWLDPKSERKKWRDQNIHAEPISTARGIPCFDTDDWSMQVGPPSLFRILGDFTRPSCLLREFLAAERPSRESPGAGSS